MPRTRTPKHRSFSTTPRRPETQPAKSSAADDFSPSEALAEALATIVAGGAPAVEHALALIDADRDAAALARLQVKARERAQRAFQASRGLDQPDRRGGVRPNDEGGYDRIDENESPHDLARETQRRREARGNVTADGFILYTDPEPLSEFARRVGQLEALWRKAS